MDTWKFTLPESTKEFLASGFRSAGANSGTIFVEDPWFPGETRLVFMHGVKHPEPMFGFLFPAQARAVIQEGSSEPTLVDISTKPPYLSESELVIGRLKRKDPLYGGFADREGVKSSVRLLLREEGIVKAALFANYDLEMEAIPEEIINSLKNFLKECNKPTIENLEKSSVFHLIGKFLKQEDPSPLKNVLRILQNVQHSEDDDITPEGYLRRVLRWAHAIVQPKGGELTLSVHDFDSKSRTLNLVQIDGVNAIARKQQLKSIKVDEGNDFVSLVALRNSELLVADLTTSAFTRIQKPPLENVRSVLTIPILSSRDYLIGVLNLESSEPDYFSPQLLRAIWCAANLGAAAFRPAEMMQKLLHICSRMQQEDAEQPLDDLAEITRDHQRAHMCFIWGYSEDRATFFPLGVSDNILEHDSTPRAGNEGWSSYIYRNKAPVLIEEIKSRTDFKPKIWNGKIDNWESLEPSETPVSLHELTIVHEIKEQLGIPIFDRKDCIGVVWLKFKHCNVAPRVKRAINSLFGFVAEMSRPLINRRQTHLIRLRAQHEGMKALINSFQHDVVGGIARLIFAELAAIKIEDGQDNIRITSNQLTIWKELVDLQSECVTHLIRVAQAASTNSTLTAKRERADLYKLVEKAIFVTGILQQQPSCENRVSPGLTVNIDPVFVLLVVINLIQNSKKATPASRKNQPIILTAALKVDLESRAGVQISVEDGGKKFPQEIRDKIFVQFGKSVHVGAAGGSGYGLYLSDQFVRAHGSKINLPDDNDRGGTTFTFFLPD